jgi:hypothetical protein
MVVTRFVWAEAEEASRDGACLDASTVFIGGGRKPQKDTREG